MCLLSSGHYLCNNPKHKKTNKQKNEWNIHSYSLKGLQQVWV